MHTSVTTFRESCSLDLHMNQDLTAGPKTCAHTLGAGSRPCMQTASDTTLVDCLSKMRLSYLAAVEVLAGQELPYTLLCRLR